MERRLVGMDL